MGLINDKQIDNYLNDYKNGRIKEGLKINCALDNHLRFKQGSFNMILGHDNVGKTYWRVWYYLVLAKLHNKTFCIWTGENKAGQVFRDLIKMYAGKDLKDLSLAEVYRYRQELSQYFTFVDNSKLYKYKDLLEIFEDGDYSASLIDPYTGLDRKFSHSDNYEFLNTTRQWVNHTGKTIDVCTHPVSASGRAVGKYPDNHHWGGHIRIPSKSDTEGGKPFPNRCDDFYVVHRLTQLESMKTFTMVAVDKIKDTETGGSTTNLDEPVMCEYNNGLGFVINGVNPLTGSTRESNLITPNEDFELTTEVPFELTTEVPF